MIEQISPCKLWQDKCMCLLTQPPCALYTLLARTDTEGSHICFASVARRRVLELMHCMHTVFASRLMHSSGMMVSYK